MTKLNPNNENDAKSDIFSWDIFKSEMPKYFSDFNNWYFSILFQKCTKKKNKIKQDMCKYDSICPYLQNSTLFKWPFTCIS